MKRHEPNDSKERERSSRQNLVDYPFAKNDPELSQQQLLDSLTHLLIDPSRLAVLNEERFDYSSRGQCI